jgi:hypothetical protein
MRLWVNLAVVAGAFAAALLVARLSDRLAGFIVARYERRQSLSDTAASDSLIISLKRRETAVSIVRTTVRYIALSVAVIVAIGAASGASGTATVAWASIGAVVIGFALQRLLTDILSGLVMIFEGWFAVGDTVEIEPWKLYGVIEDISLRAVRLRAIDGATLRVHNSQILALRLRPRGLIEVRIEVFVRDADAGRRLISEAARLMPAGPTDFVRLPAVEDVRGLDDQLHHVRARAAVVAGREWLAYDFLPDLIKERAPEGLIVHGPVVLAVDDVAARRFARSLAVPRPLEEPREPLRD